MPEELRPVLDDFESIPYRRRDFERNAMLLRVIGSVPGYSELLEAAKEQAASLAPIPPEVVSCFVDNNTQINSLTSFC